MRSFFKKCILSCFLHLNVVVSFSQCLTVEINCSNCSNGQAISYRSCITGAIIPISGGGCNGCIITECSVGGFISGAPSSVIGNCNASFSSTISSSSTIICIGSSVLLSANVQSGYSYQWYRNGTAIIGATGSTYSATLAGSYYCRKCNSWYAQTCINSNTITLTTSNTPLMTSVTSKTICSGQPVNLSLTSNVSSSFTWVATSNTNVTGESTTNQIGATINNTLTNITSSNQNVIYTITPTSTTGNCSGTSQTVTITVLPNPSMTSSTSKTICSGQPVNLSLTSNVSSSFTWVATSNTNVTGESTTNQIGATINNTLTNITSSNQNVIYSVTLTSTTGNCSGTSQTVTVSVLPNPTMSSPSSITICSGQPVNLSLTSDISSNYSWVAASNTNVTGESTANQIGATINNTLTNTTSTNQNVVYTVTPTSTTGNCSGTSQIVSVYVGNPILPTFQLFPPLCTNSNFSLPISSNNVNPIFGSWTPTIVSTTTEGTFLFLFTPNSNECAQPTSKYLFVTDSITWTGQVDSDWHKPCNWFPSCVPTCCQTIYVPLTTNQPIISGNANCSNIFIDSSNGAEITINNNAILEIQNCNNTNLVIDCP